MEISLNTNYGFNIIIKAENVNMAEDVEERIYAKKEDGKTDFSKPPKRDINSEYINMFCNVLEDMMYYRKEDYNSSDLIERLFEKLPKDKCDALLTKLNLGYGTN